MFKKLFYVCLWLCLLSSTAYTDAVPAHLPTATPAPAAATPGR